VNSPPATTSPLYTASDRTIPPLRPEPSASHCVPSHAAMLVAGTLPAMVNCPPTTSIAGAGPSPSGSHEVAAYTVPLVSAYPPPRSHSPHWARASDATETPRARADNPTSLLLNIRTV